MRNRISSLLLLLVFLCSLTACRFGEKTELALYYRQQEISYDTNGLIGSQTARFTKPVTADALAETYFGTAVEESLVSPFPKGTKLIASEQKEGTLCLTVSEHFDKLSGSELSLALTCITMTFSQLETVETVEVMVENHLLKNQQSIQLSVEDIMVESDGLRAVDTILNLYYADEDSEWLIPVEFQTTAGALEEQAKLVIEQLAVEPDDETLHAVLPKNTEILDIAVEDGVCIVDFNADFYRNRPKRANEEKVTIYAIVNTLTEFEEIEEVQILIEGESRTEYTFMDLSHNLIRDPSVIQTR